MMDFLSKEREATMPDEDATQTRPLAKHPQLLGIVCEIASEGFSLTRWDTLLHEIDAAMALIANTSYCNGEIDQFDNPLPAESIEALRARES